MSICIPDAVRAAVAAHQSGSSPTPEMRTMVSPFEFTRVFPPL